MVRYTILTKMKKIFLLLLFASITVASLSYSTKNTYAQNPDDGQWWRPTYKTFSIKVGTAANGGSPANEIFGERYTYAQVVWIIHTLTDLAVGDAMKLSTNISGDATSIHDLAGSGFRPGLILSLAGYSDSFAKKPVSGIDYVAQKIQKLNPVGTAYAQNGGYGYSSSLSPIQGLWLASRNAAYLLMTFVVVILAILVMLRQKISPQVVLTAQSALPRVAIALVAITFSYSIAGFIVDLGFVVQGVISGLVAAIVAQNGASESIYIFTQVNNGVASIISYALAFLLNAFSQNGGIIANIINGGSPALDTLFNTVFTLGGTLDWLLGLVVAVLLVIAMFRIFFLLLVTYVKFILQVLAGPFILLFSVLGVGGGLSGWLRSLVAQMAVFVSIGLLVMFGHIFFWGFGNTVAQPALLPAPISDAVLQQLLNVFHVKVLVAAGASAGAMPSGFSFGNNISSVGFFVSLMVMLSIPKLASSVRDNIATGRGSYGLDLGGAYAPVSGVIGAGLTPGMSALEQAAKTAGQSPYAYRGPAGATIPSNVKYSAAKGAKWLNDKLSRM
jgi:hypothetical protein